jgi:hypothetical protein
MSISAAADCAAAASRIAVLKARIDTNKNKSAGMKWAARR